MPHLYADRGLFELQQRPLVSYRGHLLGGMLGEFDWVNVNETGPR